MLRKILYRQTLLISQNLPNIINLKRQKYKIKTYKINEKMYIQYKIAK